MKQSLAPTGAFPEDKNSREQRLAKALRANLHRRKKSQFTPPSAGNSNAMLAIEGGFPLIGEIRISGAKNAALPLLIAGLLTDQEMHLENVPNVSDVQVLLELLAMCGCEANLVDEDLGNWKLRASNILRTTAPYEMVSKMRAGFWVIAPLLARCGEARVSLPGGCAIGARPVNLYIDALRAMGAEISLEEGYINASAPHGLHGAHIGLPFVSVGATHVVAMAAVLAKGETILQNAAREPEVVNLIECLCAMGADIDGAGSSRLRIHGLGKDLLRGIRHRVLPDRIEAGTYAIAVAMTGGEATLKGIDGGILTRVRDLLETAGISIREGIGEDGEGCINVVRNPSRCRAVAMETAPYPGFPTDLQAQFMALMSLAKGQSSITETIFENRFMHVPELLRMGADISLHRDQAIVRGVSELTGAAVEATDLRASVSLVLAGLAAQGETRIGQIHHLDRGFESLEAKLSACGARIRRLEAKKLV